MPAMPPFNPYDTPTSLLRYRAWCINNPRTIPDANDIIHLVGNARDNFRLQNHSLMSLPALVSQFARSLPHFREPPVCVPIRTANGLNYAWQSETTHTSDGSCILRSSLRFVAMPDGSMRGVASWNAVECRECGRLIRRSDSRPGNLCWDCASSHRGEDGDDEENETPADDENPDYQMTILDHDANVLHYFPEAQTRARTSSDLLFGVELEFDCPRSYTSIPREAIAANLTGQFPLICKTDGSVPRGMEINTVPAPLQEQRQLIQQLLNAIPRRALRTTNGCGLHIHVSRRPMSEDQMARMIVFMNAHQTQDLIRQIARRSSDQWARVIPKTLNQAKRDLGGNDKYVALNTSHTTTLEFRVFRSSLSQATVCACLEFCAALCDYCAPTPSSEAWLEPIEFYAYVTRRRREFKNLARWISRVPQAKRLIDEANKQGDLPLCA